MNPICKCSKSHRLHVYILGLKKVQSVHKCFVVLWKDLKPSQTQTSYSDCSKRWYWHCFVSKESFGKVSNGRVLITEWLTSVCVLLCFDRNQGYSSSKFGINLISNAIDQKLRDHCVYSHVTCPGFSITGMTSPMLQTGLWTLLYPFFVLVSIPEANITLRNQQLF